MLRFKTLLVLILVMFVCTACQYGQENSSPLVTGPALPPGFQVIQTPNSPLIQGNSPNYISPNPNCTADQVKLLARCGKGHADAISWAPDQIVLAISSSTGTHLYDVIRKVEVLFLDTSSYQVQSSLFSPDGLFLALASTEGVIHLWSLASKEVVAIFDEPRRANLPARFKGISFMAFSNDGKLLATIDTQKNFLLWRIPDGSPYSFEAQPLQADQIQFLPDGEKMAVDGSGVRVYRLSDWKLLSSYYTESDSNSTISPDGKWIASTRPDGSLFIRPVGLAEVKFYYNFCQGSHCGKPLPKFSPRGDLLAAALGESVKFWNPSTAQLVNSISLPDRGTIFSFAFSPDEKYLSVMSASIVYEQYMAIVSGSLVMKSRSIFITSEGHIYLYRLDNYSLIRSDQIYYPGDWYISGSESVWYPYWSLGEANVNIGFSNDSRMFAYFNNGTPVIWNTGDGQDWDLHALQEFYEIITNRPDYYYQYYQTPPSKVSLRGTFLYVPASGERFKVWNIGYGALDTTLQTVPGSPTAAPRGLENALQPKTESFLQPYTVEVNPERVLVRRNDNGRIFFGQSMSQVTSAILSPDYKYLSTRQADGMTQIWDLTTGFKVAGFTGFAPFFSPNGAYLISYTSDRVNIYRTKDWNRVASLERQLYGDIIAFWPDAETALMATGDSSQGTHPRLVRLDDGKNILELNGGKLIPYYNPSLLVSVQEESGTTEVWGCK